MSIKPIETYYNGYRFRSRLEARWAVFWDALSVKYEYETEGFENYLGEKYLPDFYLNDLNIYVEVKPRDAFSIEFDDHNVIFEEKNAKYLRFTKDIADGQSAMWFVFGDPCDAIQCYSLEKFNKISNHTNYMFGNGLCSPMVASLAGEDVKCCCDGKEVDPSECGKKAGLVCGSVFAFVDGAPIITTPDDMFIDGCKAIPLTVMLNTNQNEDPTPESVESLRSGIKETIIACKNARQARFEHGESGVPA